jgi:hypothetical protein
MSIETGLYSELTGDAGVSALVSTRIYPLQVPQDVAMPAVAYQQISGSPEYAHDGDSGLNWARFQFTCQAETYAGAKALAVAVKAALSGASGTMDDTTVDVILIDNETDWRSEGFDIPVVRVDVMVWYQV